MKVKEKQVGKKKSDRSRCSDLSDGGVLQLPVLECVLQVLFPQSLDGSDLEFIVGQQLTELLCTETRSSRSLKSVCCKKTEQRESQPDAGQRPLSPDCCIFM